MEPQIRYCTTSDGVRIAYTVTGEGPPHVFVTEPIVSHVQLEWSQPLFSRLLGRLARHNMLVRFDSRNSGLSDRGLAVDVNSARLDIEAVVRRAGLETFSLTGVQGQSLGVIAFTAAHPEQVSRLVFIDGFSRIGDMAATQAARALIAALDVDFELGTELIGAAAFGAGRDESRDYGAYIRSCIDASWFSRSDGEPADVTDLARAITVPTLILKHAGVQYVSMDMVRDLAANIAGARMSVVPGGWADDPEGLADRVGEFINETAAVSTGAGKGAHALSVGTADASATATSGMAVILFTDIVDSTALTERLGDTVFRTASRALDEAMRAAMREAGGTPVDGKVLGDGVMGVFTSASQAIAAARRCVELSGESELRLHVGLHAGDVTHEDGNVYGGAVNIASRICGLSAPGEILVSATIRELARTSAGVVFEDRGEHALKGVADAVRVYAVRGVP
ncbi:MAG: adenylate/guanylate cyclase domain-containing protein [Chloroflexota bacterium]|nr:adenylate/guanylate cyclase domain-containing protein [Chloroflexota bacterium]